MNKLNKETQEKDKLVLKMNFLEKEIEKLNGQLKSENKNYKIISEELLIVSNSK